MKQLQKSWNRYFAGMRVAGMRAAGISTSTLVQGSSYIWPAARSPQPATRSPQNSQFGIYQIKEKTFAVIWGQ